MRTLRTAHARLDIGPPAIDKAQRLLECAQRRGISPQDALAFGRRGHALAAAQAKEAAGKIIGDNNSDATAETIGIWLGEGAGDRSPLCEWRSFDRYQLAFSFRTYNHRS
jgi:hypothetical protein